MSQNTYSISPHPHMSQGNLWALPPCIVSWELVHHLLLCWLSSLLSSSLLSSSLLSSSLLSSSLLSSSLLFSWLSSALLSLPSWPFHLPSSLFFLQPFPLFLLLSLLSLVLFFALSSAFCFYICSVMAFFSSCSFFLCSFCSVASCFWRCFSSSWAKHSALVRRCAYRRAFKAVGMEMVGETRYLDIGEIESSEAGVSDYLPLTTDYSGDCSASEEETVTKSLQYVTTTSRTFSTHK